MDINEFFQENRKIVIIFGIVYIIVMIFVITYIWSPKTYKSKQSSDIVKYEQYDETGVQNKAMQDYVNDIAYSFMLGEYDQLVEKVSDDYLEYNGLTKNEMINELKNSGYTSYSTQITSLTQYDLGNIYVYRGELTNGKKMRYINIIETYPYEYTITFDDFYKYSSDVVSKTTEGIKFDILTSFNNISYIEYKIKVTNEDNDLVKMNLNSEDYVYIELTDGTTGKVSYTAVEGKDYTTLSKGSSVVRILMFRVPLQSQESIEKIVFKDVDMGQTEQDIELNI